MQRAFRSMQWSFRQNGFADVTNGTGVAVRELADVVRGFTVAENGAGIAVSGSAVLMHGRTDEARGTGVADCGFAAGVDGCTGSSRGTAIAPHFLTILSGESPGKTKLETG